jgi:hypothetical protein
VERVRRVELPTLCLASIRSSQLSYTRMLKVFILLDWLCQFAIVQLSPIRACRSRKN